MLQRLKTTNTLFWFALLILFLNINQALATERELLYHSSLSAPLQEIVANIQNLNHPKIPYADLNPKTEYFVRIVPRQYTLTKDNQLQANAILGTKPMFFLPPRKAFTVNLYSRFTLISATKPKISSVGNVMPKW